MSVPCGCRTFAVCPEIWLRIGWSPKSYHMSPEHRQALELVETSHHILWNEVEPAVRYLLCDLLLDKLLQLDYLEGKPFVFVLTEDGQRALQALRMGVV